MKIETTKKMCKDKRELKRDNKEKTQGKNVRGKPK